MTRSNTSTGEAMKKGDKIFVYGTLRPHPETGGGMMKGRAEHLGTDRIPGRLYDISWFPGVKLGGEGMVTGDVFEITDPELPDRLDAYEGYPDLYTREQVETEGGHTVWVYIINREVSEDRRIPSGEWLREKV